MYSAIRSQLIITMIIIQCFPFFSFAQVVFQRTYGGSLINEGRSVQQTFDGGYIIAGSTSSFGNGSTDVLLIKTDSAGNPQFTRTYGGANIDRGYSVVQLSDSGYAIAGYTNSFGNGGYDGYLIRTDKNGDTLWTKTFGGADWDFIYSLKVTTDDGFVMAGNTNSYNAGKSQSWILKTDGSGIIQWQTHLSISTESSLNGIMETADSNYVATGYLTEGLNNSNDILVLKLNSLGDSIWSRSFGDSLDDVGTSLDITDSGKYIIGATITNVGSHYTDDYFIKLDTTGNEEWHKEFPSTKGDFLNSVIRLKNGDYVATGFTNFIDNNGEDATLIMIDNIGANFQGSNYGGLGNEVGYEIKQCTDGGFIIIGETNSYGPGIESVYVIKTDSLRATGNNVQIPVIEFNSENEFECFPNPANSFLYIQLKNEKGEILSDEQVEISILDMAGQKVFSSGINLKTLNAKDYALNVSNLENGCFILSIISDRINSRRKILIYH